MEEEVRDIFLSAIMQEAPEEHVVAWLDRQTRTSRWIASVTVFEIQHGLQILPAGKRRSLLPTMFERVLKDVIGRRVAPFDTAAAHYSAGLMASRHKKGHIVDLRDTMIAGVPLASHATLATRSVSHFEGLSVTVVNPWLPHSG